ncbi:Mannose-P-dolichol utilization defect 1 protein [Zostera marina]|uniref:Mannose-P-dolichol utilization defect 1 protein homolog n=1 Tax=Zostera marina TaxID=29655 RepID=A0A0K9PJB6_ZOSMR|nr:Mannose-P-dolichol utilization defect 1 protein [Zostera marina]
MELEILGMNFGCVLQSLSNLSFPEKDCLLPLMAKVLGYCIVVGSTSVKLPQIIKISRSKSVQGLSIISFELEIIGYTIGLAYCVSKGIPFSAYGEYFFLLIQSIVLISIIYYFSSPLRAGTLAKIMFYCAIAPSVFAGRIEPVLFEALFAGQHAIFFFARVPQIWTNYNNQSTGELSFLTSLMNFAGALVRLFTCVQERAPRNMTLGSMLGILLNGTILTQILMYHRKAHMKKEKKME